MTLKVLLNNQSIELATQSNLTTVLKTQGYQNQSFAVAINKTFIPKAQYDQVILKEGDDINIVTPMQGG